MCENLYKKFVTSSKKYIISMSYTQRAPGDLERLNLFLSTVPTHFFMQSKYDLLKPVPTPQYSF